MSQLESINQIKQSLDILTFLINKVRQGDLNAQFEIGKYFLEHHKPKWGIRVLENASLYGHLEAEKYLRRFITTNHH